MTINKEELKKVVSELKEFKLNIYGVDAIDKIRQMYMMSGIFAYSFEDSKDRTTAYSFVSIMAHHSGRRDADIAGVLAEYLDNWMRIEEGIKPVGKCCISRLDDELFIFMKTNINHLIDAANYLLYGNKLIDDDLPYGHLLKSQKQAEAIYLKYLEANFTIIYNR